MFRHLLRRVLYAVSSPTVILFDGPPAGAPAGGGGGGAAATPPAGGGAPAPSSPTSPAGGAAAVSSPTGGEPAWIPPKDKAAYDAALEAARVEARRGFVPGHRLTEETTKRQQYERDLATAEARIRALAGVDPASRVDPEVQKTREAFLLLFPEFKHLAGLTPERLAKIERALESGAHADDVVKHHWDTHASRIFDSLASDIEEALNIERMSDRQFNGMVNAFRGWARERVQVDPNFRQRYEAADPKLLADFVKEFTEDWIAPSRRQALTTVVNRPRVPAGGRTPAITTPPPNLDNIKDPEAAEDVGIQYMRDRGVRFAG